MQSDQGNAERPSEFVRLVLGRKVIAAREVHREFAGRYPIALTRSLPRAKQWLREHARGQERYGIVVSSQAQRLKPDAIDVRPKVDPVHGFLHDKDDVRPSYHLEDVAPSSSTKVRNWIGPASSGTPTCAMANPAGNTANSSAPAGIASTEPHASATSKTPTARH